jgi:hypothetical protein
MLQVGNGMTLLEDRAHFGAWVISSSPLILGFDLSDDATLSRLWPVIANPEAIAINQAWAGNPGMLVRNTSASNGDLIEVWAKPLGGGRLALFLLNMASTATSTARTANMARRTLRESMAEQGSVSVPLQILVDWGPSGWTNASARSIRLRDVWQRRDLQSAIRAGVLTTDAFGPHDSRLYLLAPSAEPAPMAVLPPVATSSSTGGG